MSRCSVLALWIALGCGGRAAVAPAGSPGGDLRFEIAAIDRSADPCAGFYDYACGGWRRSHPIPPDRTRWSRYAELVAQDLDRERSLVEAAARAPVTPAEHRVGAYYAACLDQPAIDARGFAPLAGVLAAVERSETGGEAPRGIERDGPAALVDAIAELHRQGIPVLFELYTSADPRDARRSIATLDIGALGLEDPDDYTRADAASATIRERYRAHVERVLGLIGDRDPAGDAAGVVALETALARAVPAAADRRDPEHHVHVVPSGEVAARAPALDWPRYLRARGAPELASGGEPGGEIGGEIEVEFVPYLEAVGAALAGDRSAVRAYLRYHAARALATVLPSALDGEVFDFAQRIVRGARAMRPRWQRCLALVDRDLGEDVGRMFVARWFPEPSRARARAMVDRIAAALRRELGAADWLGPPSRAAAIRKLDHMRFNIGYPDRWKSYDALVVRADDPVGNALRAGQLATARELAKLGQPTDRGEFFALPQSLDGSGTNRLVAIQFTAGFLQPPVFDPRVDDPINFGGFGGVIGHEITHHFDDEGRKFDEGGNLAPWWSDADVAAYQARAACFVDEYAQFRIDDGTPLDGRLTLGENLADNGGLRLAWDALQPSADGPRIDEQGEAKGGGDPAGSAGGAGGNAPRGIDEQGEAKAGGNAPRGIDGFTPAQRFFLAWAQIRCENTTPEAARVAVHSDPHAPGRWRVDGVVRNLPGFAAAFSCPSGAPMAPVARCRLW